MVNRSLCTLLLLSALLLPACSELGLGERSPTGASGNGGTAFERFYTTGKQQMASNRVGLAIVNFERALALDPRSVKVLNALGACYDDLHRYDIALGFYEQALAIEPQSADTLNNMAVSLAMAGSPTDAEHMLRKAASLDPTNETIQLNIAGLNSLGTAHASPKRTEVQTAAEADPDPRRPRIERMGMQTYMLYVGEKHSAKIGDRSASPLSHKAALKISPSSARNGRITAGIHHARLVRSGTRHKHTHEIMRAIGVSMNIRSRSGIPNSTRNAHWR